MQRHIADRQFIAVLEVHRDQTGLAVRIKLRKRGLFDRALLRNRDQILILREFLNRNHRGDALSLHQIEEVDRRRSLGGSGCLRYLVGFDLMRLAGISKEHQIIVRRGHDHVLDKIVFAGRDAGYALAAALLRLIGIDRNTLDISKVCKRNADVFFFDQIFLVDFALRALDLGSALIAPFFFDLGQLILDHAHQLMLVSKQLVIISNLL